MRRNLWIGSFVVLTLLLASVSSTLATTVKGRSGYGPGPGSDLGLTFTSCANPTGDQPCMIFDLTSIGTATLNGTTSLNIVQFAFNPSGAGGQVLDVIDLGALSAGTFTLTSSLFSASGLEVFACTDSPSSATTLSDSLSVLVPGPCTPNLTSAPFTSTSLTLTNPATGQFALSQSVSDLVLDFTPGATTAAPEPASIALLGFGLAAIGARLRRKAA